MHTQSSLQYKVTMHPIDDSASLPDDAALDPEAMLALLNDQRRSVEGQMAAFVPAIITLWGVIWLLGFTVLWLIDGLGPAFSLPLPLAIGIFVALLAVGIVVSAVLGIRSGRGIRGNATAAFTGAVYGATWSVGAVAIVVFGQGLYVNGMDRELANIFYPVAFVVFAGIMNLVAGAIWHAVPSIILGVWTVLVAVIAPFFGYPTHYLVLALAGGLGYLALGIAMYVRLHRVRRRALAPAAVRRG